MENAIIGRWLNLMRFPIDSPAFLFSKGDYL